MELPYLTSRHPLVQLLLFALICIGSFISVALVSAVAGMLLYKVPLSEWMNLLDLSDPANIRVLKFMQITQAISLFVIPPVIFGWLMSSSPWKYLQVDRRARRIPLLTVTLLAVSMVPVLNLLALLNEGMKLPEFLSGIESWMKQAEEQAGDLTVAFLKVDTFGGFLVNLLMIVLIPAFGEEFFFRGTLQQLLHRWIRSPHAAIIAASVVFAAFHLQFYGFLPRFTQGMIFGYMLFWTGNLWYPILGHGINNLMPVVLAYLFPKTFSPEELGNVFTGSEAWLWALPGILVSAGLLVVFRKGAGRREEAGHSVSI